LPLSSQWTLEGMFAYSADSSVALSISWRISGSLLAD
jgi:hypothetical protein